MNNYQRAARLRIIEHPHTLPSHKGHIKDTDNYSTLHSWAKAHFDDPGHCEICMNEEKKLDWAIHRGKKYSRNREDWIRMCRSCHVSYDHKLKTHCIHGHEYTEQNSYVANGKRWCRTCRNIANRKLYWKKKEEVRQR